MPSLFVKVWIYTHSRAHTGTRSLTVVERARLTGPPALAVLLYDEHSVLLAASERGRYDHTLRT